MAGSVMLAKKWSEKTDPTGWYMSEKLDGVRAYWTGSAFYSRNGNKYCAPDFFIKDLPKCHLDGELWCGRGLFSKTLSIVKKTKNLDQTAPDWKYVTYLVFDAPEQKGGFEERFKFLKKTIQEDRQSTYAAVVGQMKCTGPKHLKQVLKEVLKKGGEGIMLRKPGSSYDHSRSANLLKCKYFHDEEAKVTGSEKGSGRCSSMMGKLHCVLPNGGTFKVGTGFSDAQRKNPPKKGAVITFKYQELSNHGNPRFPVFVRERPELSWDDVIQAAKEHPPFSQLKMKKPELNKKHSIMFSTIPSRDQSTGKKQVTSDDEDSSADIGDGASSKKGAKAGKAKKAANVNASANSSSKPVCKYGALCYRTNQDHLDKFSHPSRDDEDAGAGAGASGGSDDEGGKKAKKPKKGKKSDDSDMDVVPPMGDSDDEHSHAKQAKQKPAKGHGGNSASSSLSSNSKPGGKRKHDDANQDLGAEDDEKHDDLKPDKDGKIPCQWGSECYRQSKVHLLQYSHHPVKGTDDDKLKKKTKDEDDDSAHKHMSDDEDEVEDGKWGIGSASDNSDDEKDVVSIPKKAWEQYQLTVKALSGDIDSRVSSSKPSNTSSVSKPQPSPSSSSAPSSSAPSSSAQMTRRTSSRKQAEFFDSSPAPTPKLARRVSNSSELDDQPVSTPKLQRRSSSRSNKATPAVSSSSSAPEASSRRLTRSSSKEWI